MRIITTLSVNRIFIDMNIYRMDKTDDIKQNWRCNSLDNGYITVTNEYSLFTKVVKITYAMELIEVINLISIYRIDNEIDSLAIYSYENKKVMGSINDMKRIASRFSDNEMESYEILINKTPFKYLGYKTPSNVHYQDDI